MLLCVPFEEDPFWRLLCFFSIFKNSQVYITDATVMILSDFFICLEILNKSFKITLAELVIE